MGAQYPGQVWDGSSPSRTVVGDPFKGPDAFDWAQVTAELQASQTDLLSLSARNVGVMAPNNLVAGLEIIHDITIADATGDTTLVVAFKFRVTSVSVLKTTANGGAGDTVTVKNGSTAITNAISLNAVAKTLVPTTTLDPAQTDVLAGGTLTVTAAKSTSVACQVRIKGYRIL